jgi:hypothetical protein
MAIIQFTSAEPGRKGDTGIPNDRDINSMIMLSWDGGSPAVKSFDLYTNNLDTTDGIDPDSVCNWNPAGYYEPTISPAYYETTRTINDTSYLSRSNKMGAIYRWVQDNGDTGHFEGATRIISGAVNNRGGGKVGLPCVNHGFVVGAIIEVRNTTNYNGIWLVDVDSSINEIVIVAVYVAETITSASVNQRITLGLGMVNSDIQAGLSVEFPEQSSNILSITSSGYRYSDVKLSSSVPTSIVTGVYDVLVDSSVLSPSYNYSTSTSGWSRLFNNSPDPRRYFAMAYDNNSKHLWMFGGYRHYSGVKTNELWKYSTVSGQWTLMSPPSSPSARDTAAMAFDPVNNNLIVFCGYTQSPAVYVNETWRYSVVSGTWTQLAPGGTALSTSTFQQGAVYVAASGTILTWGGSKSGTRTNEMWEYNVEGNSWKKIAYGGTGPSARWDHQMCYQTASGALWVMGGNTGSENAETWKYNYTTTNTWTQFASAPVTIARGLAFCDELGYMNVITGLINNNGGYFTNMYRFLFSTNSWTSLLPGLHTSYTNVAPMGTAYFTAGGYDPDNKVYYHFFSGDTSHVNRCELWKYDPVTTLWTNTYPEPRRRSCMALNSKTNKLYVGCGTNQWDQSPYYDMWEIDINQTPTNISNMSTRLFPTTWPWYNYRDLTQWVYSPNLDCIFMFSGRDASNDLWKYDFAQRNWIQMNPMGIYPAQRQEAAYVYDTDNDVFYIYSGYNYLANWWKYDPINNTYLQLPTPTIWPTGRNAASLVYDSINKCLWLFAGFSYTLGNVVKNDLWKYDIASSLWTQVIYAGYLPTARQNQSMAFDPVTQSLLISHGGSYTNDFLRYDIRSNVMYYITDTAVSTGLLQGKDLAPSAFSSATGDYYMWSGVTTTNWQTNDLWKYNLWKMATPSGMVTTTTSGWGINTNSWSALNKVSVSYEAGGLSDIYHALSFNQTSTFSILDVGDEVSLSPYQVVNLGGGQIGFPSATQTFSGGDLLRLYGTLNYNIDYLASPNTTPNQVVVSGTYAAELLTTAAKVRKVIGWRDIVQNNAGVWQYRDMSNSWQSSPLNTPQNALLYALTVSGNRTNSNALSAIRSNEFALPGGFTTSTKSLECGWGFLSSQPFVPKFKGYTVGYTTEMSDLTLITETWLASSVNPVSALCLFKVYYSGAIVLNTDLKAWISTDNGGNYEQVSNLSVLRTDGSYTIIKGSIPALVARGDSRIKFKITTHNSKGIAVSSLGMALRY